MAEKSIKDSFDALYRQHGLTPPGDSTITPTVDHSTKDSFDSLYRQHGLTPPGEGLATQPMDAPIPADDTSWYGQMYGSGVRGFTGMVSSGIKGIGITAYNLHRRYPGVFGGTEGATFEEWTAGKTGQGGSYRMGQWVEDLGEWMSPEESQRYKDDFWITEVPRGLGTAAGFLVGSKGLTRAATGGAEKVMTRATARAEAGHAAHVAAGGKALGKVEQALVAQKMGQNALRRAHRRSLMAMGGSVQGVEGWSDAYAQLLAKAKAEGRDHLNDRELDMAWDSFLWNIPAGMTEAFGVEGAALGIKLFKNLDRTTGGAWGKGLRKVALDIGKGAAREAAQESFQTAWMNLGAAHIAKYDENRRLFEQVLHSGQVGGAVGAIMGGIVSAVGRKARLQSEINRLQGMQALMREQGNPAMAEKMQEKIDTLQAEVEQGGSAAEARAAGEAAEKEFLAEIKKKEDESWEEWHQRLAEMATKGYTENEDGTVTMPDQGGWTMTTVEPMDRVAASQMMPVKETVKEVREVRNEELWDKAHEAQVEVVDAEEAVEKARERVAVATRSFEKAKGNEKEEKALDQLGKAEEKLEAAENNLTEAREKQAAADKALKDQPVVEKEVEVPKPREDIRVRVTSPDGMDHGEMTKQEALALIDEKVGEETLEEDITHLLNQYAEEAGEDPQEAEAAQLEEEGHREKMKSYRQRARSAGLTEWQEVRWTGGMLVQPEPDPNVHVDEQVNEPHEVIRQGPTEAGPISGPALAEDEVLIRNLKTQETSVHKFAQLYSLEHRGQQIAFLELGIPEPGAEMTLPKAMPAPQWENQQVVDFAKRLGFLDAEGKVLKPVYPSKGNVITFKDVARQHVFLQRQARIVESERKIKEMLAEQSRLAEPKALKEMEKLNKGRATRERNGIELTLEEVLRVREMRNADEKYRYKVAKESRNKNRKAKLDKARREWDEMEEDAAVHRAYFAHMVHQVTVGGMAAAEAGVEVSELSPAPEFDPSRVDLEKYKEPFDPAKVPMVQPARKPKIIKGKVTPKEVREAHANIAKYFKKKPDKAPAKGKKAKTVPVMAGFNPKTGEVKIEQATVLTGVANGITYRAYQLSNGRVIINTGFTYSEWMTPSEAMDLIEDSQFGLFILEHETGKNTGDNANPVTRVEALAALETKSSISLPPATLERLSLRQRSAEREINRNQEKVEKARAALESAQNDFYNAKTDEAKANVTRAEKALDKAKKTLTSSELAAANVRGELIKGGADPQTTIREDLWVESEQAAGAGMVRLTLVDRNSFEPVRQGSGLSGEALEAVDRPRQVVVRGRTLAHRFMQDRLDRTPKAHRASRWVATSMLDDGTVTTLIPMPKWVGQSLYPATRSRVNELQEEADAEARQELEERTAVVRGRTAGQSVVVETADKSVSNVDKEATEAFRQAVIDLVMPGGEMYGVQFARVKITSSGNAAAKGDTKPGDAVYVSIRKSSRTPEDIEEDITTIHVNPRLLRKHYMLKDGRLQPRVDGVRSIESVAKEELTHLLDLQVINWVLQKQDRSGRVKNISSYLRAIYNELSPAQVQSIITTYIGNSKSVFEGVVVESDLGLQAHNAVREDTLSPEQIAMEALRMLRSHAGVFLETEASAKTNTQFYDFFKGLRNMVSELLGGTEATITDENGRVRPMPKAMMGHLAMTERYLKLSRDANGNEVATRIGEYHTSEEAIELVFVRREGKGDKNLERVRTAAKALESAQAALPKAKDKEEAQENVTRAKKALRDAEKSLNSSELAAMGDVPFPATKEGYDRALSFAQNEINKLPPEKRAGMKAESLIRRSNGEVVRGGFKESERVRSRDHSLWNRINDMLITLRAIKLLEKDRQRIQERYPKVDNWGDYLIVASAAEAQIVWGERAANEEKMGVYHSAELEWKKRQGIKEGLSEGEASELSRMKLFPGYATQTDAETYYLYLMARKLTQAFSSHYQLKAVTIGGVKVRGSRVHYPSTTEGRKRARQAAVAKVKEKLGKDTLTQQERRKANEMVQLHNAVIPVPDKVTPVALVPSEAEAKTSKARSLRAEYARDFVRHMFAIRSTPLKRASFHGVDANNKFSQEKFDSDTAGIVDQMYLNAIEKNDWRQAAILALESYEELMESVHRSGEAVPPVEFDTELEAEAYIKGMQWETEPTVEEVAGEPQVMLVQRPTGETVEVVKRHEFPDSAYITEGEGEGEVTTDVPITIDQPGTVPTTQLVEEEVPGITVFRVSGGRTTRVAPEAFELSPLEWLVVRSVLNVGEDHAQTLNEVAAELDQLAKDNPDGSTAQLIEERKILTLGGKVSLSWVGEQFNSAVRKIEKVNAVAHDVQDMRFRANLTESEDSTGHALKTGEGSDPTAAAPVAERDGPLRVKWWRPGNWGAVDALRNFGGWAETLAGKIDEFYDNEARIKGSLHHGIRVIEKGGVELVGVDQHGTKRGFGRGNEVENPGAYFYSKEEALAYAKKNKWKEVKYTAEVKGYGRRKMRKSGAYFAEYIRLRERAGDKEATERNRAIAEFFLRTKAPEVTRKMVAYLKNAGIETAYQLREQKVLVLGDNGFREIQTLGEWHFPRMFKEETWALINNPDLNRLKYDQLREAMVKTKTAKSMAAAGKMLQSMITHVNDYTSEVNDYFANMEKARGWKLPDEFYDTTFDAYLNYLNRYSTRIAQIMAFGQGRDGKAKTAWDVAANAAEGGKAKEYVEKLHKSTYRSYQFDDGIVKMLLKIGMPITAVTYLSGPLTAIRNTTFALRANAESFGAKNTLWVSLKGLVDSVKGNYKSLSRHGELGMGEDMIDAELRGAMRTDFTTAKEYSLADSDMHFGAMAQYQKASNRAVRVALWMQRMTEQFNRSVTATLALQHLRRTHEALKENPEGKKAQQYVAMITRLGYMPDQIKKLMAVDEDGHWAPDEEARDKFIRDMVNEKQYGYNIRQHPLWLDAPMGRVLFQFQRWGFMRTRDFARNVWQPIAKGTTVTMPDGKVYKNVRNGAPALRNLFLFIGQGELYASLLMSLFYDRERDEVIVPVSEQEESMLMAMSERLYMDMVYDGGLGIVTDWINWTNPLDRRGARYKQPIPLNPPAWSLAEDTTHMVMDINHILKDDSNLGAKREAVMSSIWKTVRRLPFIRAAQGSSYQLRRALELEDYALRVQDGWKDVMLVRGAARRFAKAKGYEDERIWTGGRSVHTEKRELYSQLVDALMAGDKVEARRVRDRLVGDKKGRDKKAIMRAIAASVRARQPLLLDGKQPDDKVQREFLRWAKKELPDYEDRIVAIHTRYWRTARLVGLK